MNYAVIIVDTTLLSPETWDDLLKTRCFMVRIKDTSYEKIAEAVELAQEEELNQ